MKEAREKLKQFLDAWKNKDIPAMYEACQKTWKATHGYDLLEHFATFDISGYRITGSVEAQKGIVADCTFTITVNNKQSKPGKVRILCELEPYKASPKGTWGVNPVSATSILKNIEKIIRS
jgi:hypothetical protein